MISLLLFAISASVFVNDTNAFSTQSPFPVYQLQQNASLFKRSLTRTHESSLSVAGTPEVFSSSDGTVSITLYCDISGSANLEKLSDKDLFCPRVRETFRLAAELLTERMLFTKPISVQAVFHSFCRKESPNTFSNDPSGACTEYSRSTLGNGRPATFYKLNSNDKVLYPSALARQRASPDMMMLFTQFDIGMEFNTDFASEFYMPTASQVGFPQTPNNAPPPMSSITRNQYDLLSLSMHELFHGLGIVSFYDIYLQTISPVPPSLSPKPSYLETLVTPPIENNQISEIGIYDSLLYETSSQTPIMSQLPALASWVSTALQPTPQQLPSPPDVFVSAFTTPGAIYVASPSDPKRKLMITHTPPEFEQGTSLVHGVSGYRLRPAASKGKAFQSLDETDLERVYSVLNAMGYEVKGGIISLRDDQFSATSNRRTSDILLVIFGMMYLLF